MSYLEFFRALSNITFIIVDVGGRRIENQLASQPQFHRQIERLFTNGDCTSSSCSSSSLSLPTISAFQKYICSMTPCVPRPLFACAKYEPLLADLESLLRLP